MRTALPASQADQHLKRAGRSKARHQGSRRGHLARQLHALRSRILRPGAENPATSPQPVRHNVVTKFLGTTCHLCVRAGHPTAWLGRQDSNLRMAESKSPDKAKGRKDRNVRVKERPLAPAAG